MLLQVRNHHLVVNNRPVGADGCLSFLDLVIDSIHRPMDSEAEAGAGRKIDSRLPIIRYPQLSLQRTVLPQHQVLQFLNARLR